MEQFTDFALFVVKGTFMAWGLIFFFIVVYMLFFWRDPDIQHYRDLDEQIKRDIEDAAMPKNKEFRKFLQESEKPK